MAPCSPHPEQCLCGTSGCEGHGYRVGAQGFFLSPGPGGDLAHSRPLSPQWGDARVSWQDAVGSGKRGTPHPPCTRRADGVAKESTLSLVLVLLFPPRRAKGMGKSPRAGATPQRALPGDRQPGTTASAGSGILRASEGWARAGVWSRTLHGRHADPEPCAQGGGKQRGLGRDMPEPRHAVNSLHRSSNYSAGSQRRAFVSWKPDGALASTGTARPATAPSQAQAPGAAEAVQHPLGRPESWGCPLNGQTMSGCLLPRCLSRPAVGVSQVILYPKGMLYLKGSSREKAFTGGEMSDPLKSSTHLCVVHCASVSLWLPSSRRLKLEKKGWSSSHSPPGSPT